MDERRPDPAGADHERAALAEQFERFARTECGESPLYRRLALVIAGDRDLLALAAAGDRGPKPNLFLAAVHYLLLGGTDDPLARFYPSVSPEPAPAAGLSAAFRSFCFDNAESIRSLLRTRRVQTNEVARSALLLPGFAWIADRVRAQALVTVEVGASAGLLLHWDQYGYDYGDGRQYGGGCELVIRCAVRGTHRPPLPDPLPVVHSRTGIDLHPVDLTDDDQVRWLRALVWPDQPDRAERLRRAVAVALRRPVTLIEGDALTALPGVLERLPADGYLCLFHAHTFNQFSPAARRRYDHLLADHAQRRDLCDLSLESIGGDAPVMALRRFVGGRIVEQQALARYDAHGRWLEWMATAERG